MLHSFQAAVRDLIVGRTDGSFADRDANDGTAMRVFLAVHRATFLGSLTEVLAGAYPALRRALGPGRFRAVAAAFLHADPPRRAVLFDYGAALPDFLATRPETIGAPWIPGLARLEWARHEAYFAADAGAVGQAVRLAAASGSADGLRVRLHPSCRFVTSSWPVDALREWILRRPFGGLGRDPESAPVRLVVWRSRNGVRERRLGLGEMATLQALHAGVRLPDAADSAGTLDPGFDLEALLADAIAGGLLAYCGAD